MKKLLLTCTLTCIAFCQMFASVVTSSTAQTVALNYFKGISGNTSSDLSATLIYTKAESNQTADFYVFNIAPVPGFVIVSANDNAQPVIAYSTESKFSTDFSKIGLSNWMNTAAAKINNIVTNNIAADANITNLWSAYKQGNLIPSSRSSTVAPLLTTTWNQYPLYNLFCPYNSTDAQTCVTGCVATAMAQIMKFWNYPTTGTGSYSYDDAPPDFSYNYGVQSANFGATTYKWASMPNAATGASNDTAIATLMYDCGVAVAMDYGDLNEGGSGAYVLAAGLGGYPCAQTAYSTYFSYNANTMQGVQQSSYTSAAWVTLLEGELNAGRPLQYEGFDPSAGGHTWVCDGYDASGNFHMNWGWGGEDNGYFSVTSLSVGGYTFNTDDAALIGIEPAITVSCGIPAGLNSASVSSSSATVNWGAVSGASSYNLQYQASGASAWTTISLTGTSYSITGLAAGTTYNFEVQTVCPGGLSSFSTLASFTTLTGCGAPGSLTATSITATSATLSWATVTGASSYNLQYQASGASTWTTVSLTGTTYNLTGLTTGITYNYQVETVCSSGSSTYSSAASFTTLTNCGIAAGLSASAITTNSATISWDAVTGATSYTLEYELAGSSGWSTFSLSGTVVDFSGLTAGTTYNFAVQTVCSSGTSAYTAVSSFTTLSAATCGVPTGLASGSISSTAATVSWGAVTGASSYNLEYQATGASTWTTVSLTGTTYGLTGLTAGTSYNYAVQTICSSGSSTYSNPSSFTTSAAATCGVPAALASSLVTTTSASVSWGAVSGASTYNLEYKISSATSWTTVSLTGTSYNLSGLTSGTIYDYQVQTICSSGSSAYSTESTFTTLTSCGVPAGLTSSSVTTSGASVSWGSVSGASAYNLAYKTSVATAWTTVSVSGSSYSLTGLTAGTIYDYQVQTVCSSGSSAFSTASSFTTSTATGCAVPAGLTSSLVTTSTASVSWNAVSGATSYNFQYKLSGSSSWSTLSLTGTEINFSDLTAGTTYDYQVQTICSSGSSAYSAGSFTTLTTSCGVPTALSASSLTTTTATLTWAAVTGATSYNLEYKTSAATTWTTISLSGITSNLTGLTASTTYDYQVQTVCSNGSSAYSSVSSFTTLTSCGVPNGLASSSVTTTSGTVSWGAVSGATSYNLEYKTSSATTWTSVSLTGVTSNLTGLTAGTTYDYQVQTVCSSGSSAYSTASSFTTLTSCGVPSGLASSSVTTTNATVTWGAVNGATSYNLEYKTSVATTWTTISLTGVTSNLTGLTAGTTYDYQVQTVCSSGSSAYSTASSFTTLTSCGVPGGLISSSVTTTTTTVSWGAVSGATSYNLEYKTSSATTWTNVSLTGVTSNLTGLTAGTTYDYQVQTVCSSGSSAYSTASSFTTLTSCGVPAELTATSLTPNSATVSWSEVTGATSYNLQYKTSSATTWTTISVTGISSNLAGLDEGTTYDYQVQTICSSGLSAYSAASSFTTTSGTVSYCTIQGNTAFEYIESVAFGSFSYSSGNTNGGYGNNTSLTVPMASGSTVTFSLTPGFTTGSFDEYFAIYIDYKNDGLFTDPGDEVFVATGSNSTTTGSFNVPAGLSGTSRMRIVMQYGAEPSSPCGTFSWGDAEDYTVNFSSTGLPPRVTDMNAPSTNVNAAPAPWIFPNPASSIIHVLLVPVQNIQTKVEILSVTGQIITSYMPAIGGREADLDVSGLAAGVYIVRTTYGEDRTSVAKLIKL